MVRQDPMEAALQKKMTAVLFLLISVRAQDAANQPDADVDPLHPSMAVMLVVLVVILCATFLMVAYAKFCHTQDRRHRNQGQGLGRIVRSRSRFSGIDRRIVESLPFFLFSSLRGSKEGLECAVCLSGFEDTEILRLLPRCRHAFHMNCIDKWLENHSSCPLCRCKFDASDLINLADRNPTDEQTLEFYIQREESSRERSSRFDMMNTLQRVVAKARRDEPLIGEFRIKNNDSHRFGHKIIVSDVMCRSRWSDVNSSDLMSLNSQMLDVLSSRRFSSAKEHILKIKENFERMQQPDRNLPADDSDNELDHTSTSKQLDPSQKRSMSEISNVPRFKEFPTTSKMGMDDNVRKLWLPIARKTVRKFGC
ncbi:E3 ubiquitin-protein ligase ATL42-like [Andrographis paniculata]|uniref:E3 ubiquitin-protein ligase ATL42-like n=1 Tax=Andrographis paniculata TaxID=175694 RepID=UPI0021E80BDB|nr:E3 ubiquitin-protein ligase ATL42-like [Andrographis paniculata]